MIIITNHARERILERVKCRPHKVEKVAKKAYNSNEKIRKIFLTRRKFNGYENVEYRMFQGCVFCYGLTEQGKPILITVLENTK